MADKVNTLPKGHLLQSPHYTYRIESVLGSGGFGITYLATANIKVGNVYCKGKFAIKEHFISSDCEREPESSRVVYSNPAKERVENSRKDFIAEAKRLHKVGINHPNIVKVNEVFEANNTAYYVMEYLEGVTLRSMVEKNGVIEEDALSSIINPIIEAMRYLHKNRMTHLDIKPDNIMLSADESGILRPVLIDFGLSKHYDKNGNPTSTINTIAFSHGYAPIEQYAGITTFSPSADIYALGATVWYCLTGKNPKKSTELREGELANSLPFASDYLKQFIQGACNLDRSHREIHLLQSTANNGLPEFGQSNTEKHNDGNKTVRIDRGGNSAVSDYKLFKINKTTEKIVLLIAVLLIVYETIFIGKGHNCWYKYGFNITIKQISTLLVYCLSVYGLLQTNNFIFSKRLKYIWAFGVAMAIYCIDSSYFRFDSLLISLSVFAVISFCYELIVNKYPKYTQIGFVLSIMLSLFWYIVY